MLEGEWSLKDDPCELNEKEFPTDVEALRRARLSITELERLKIENFDKMKAQFAFLEREGKRSGTGFLQWLERKPGAFSLQTSTDRFYSDFLAKLKDGRLVAVEYKGGHLYAGAEEKRMMGELWENTSGGKCVFAMPTAKDWSEIERKIAA